MKMIDFVKPETLIGTKFSFPKCDENEYLDDITFGKVYTVAGIEVDGELYFMDDVGDRNYAGMDDNSHGTIVLEK